MFCVMEVISVLCLHVVSSPVFVQVSPVCLGWRHARRSAPTCLVTSTRLQDTTSSSSSSYHCQSSFTSSPLRPDSTTSPSPACFTLTSSSLFSHILRPLVSFITSFIVSFLTFFSFHLSGNFSKLLNPTFSFMLM